MVGSMPSLKELFVPTLAKTILLILLFLIYLKFFTPSACITQLDCPARADTPGAIEYTSGKYFIESRSIPFSCESVCNENEYRSALMRGLLFNLIVPLILLYSISSLLVFGYYCLNRR